MKIYLGLLLGLLSATASAASVGVWVNRGEDKVAREELRYTADRLDVRNSIWDGRRVSLVAARGETVHFNIVIESAEVAIGVKKVSMQPLQSTDDDGVIPATDRDANDGLFDFRGRNIELFYVRYLPILGCSTLSYEHFDERHVPKRFRRSHDPQGYATGKWTDRPDHGRNYPDIAVPIELHPNFKIAAGQNQSVWVDVHVPANTAPGDYQSKVTIEGADFENIEFPVQVRVINFALPELPTAKTMLYVSREDINRRYSGHKFMDDANARDVERSETIIDRHFQIAHRHRVSLIHEHTPIEQMDDLWRRKLDGSLFTADAMYDGPGIGIGNNVFSIGTYGTWPWQDRDRDAMWQSSDRWVNYFGDAQFKTPTDYFLYLIDESDEYDKIETWSRWVLDNPGPGKSLQTLATMPLPAAKRHTPSLTLPCSTVSYGITRDWTLALPYYQNSRD